MICRVSHIYSCFILIKKFVHSIIFVDDYVYGSVAEFLSTVVVGGDLLVDGCVGVCAREWSKVAVVCPLVAGVGGGSPVVCGCATLAGLSDHNW